MQKRMQSYIFLAEFSTFEILRDSRTILRCEVHFCTRLHTFPVLRYSSNLVHSCLMRFYRGIFLKSVFLIFQLNFQLLKSSGSTPIISSDRDSGLRPSVQTQATIVACAISSVRGSGCRPYQKLAGLRSRVANITTAAQPFFACLVKCFSVTLSCSDFVYGEISSIPTELISNSVSKFVLEKKLRSLKLSHFRVQRGFSTLVSYVFESSPYF